MAIIEANFAPPKTTFDYPSYRAEFVRRKKLSTYQRIREDADRAHEAAQADAAALVNEHGVPHWAEYQDAPGIMNTVHTWKAERFHDPNTMMCNERGLRIEASGKVRYTDGLLQQVRNIYNGIEPDAVSCIESESQTWMSAEGRTFLTPEEFRIHNLAIRYLAESDTFKFRVKYQGLEANYHTDGSPVEEFMHRWISRMTGLSVTHIETVLITVENIYRLRATIGLDSEPEVKVNIAKRYATIRGKAA